MKAAVARFDAAGEVLTAEACLIIELSNTADDPDVSIARARLLPGVTTRRHRLLATAERYVILEGSGRVHIGALTPQQVGVGDVVLIPPACPQCITNTGARDLIFLAICSPRFRAEAYDDIDAASRSPGDG